MFESVTIGLDRMTRLFREYVATNTLYSTGEFHADCNHRWPASVEHICEGINRDDRKQKPLRNIEVEESEVHD